MVLAARTGYPAIDQSAPRARLLQRTLGGGSWSPEPHDGRADRK